MLIDYKLLQSSIDYYAHKGYSRIEVPWTTSEAISNLTKPADKINFQLKHNDKCLVASAEQGFLSLINKGFLTAGSYQAVTPCFRDDQFSTIHSKYFIKNELIKVGEQLTNSDVVGVLEDAIVFFENIIGKEVSVIHNDGVSDIEYNGIEIGSYGFRDLGFVKYVYGTGLALPRFSRAIKLKSID